MSCASIPCGSRAEGRGDNYINYLRRESGKCLAAAYLPTYLSLYPFTHFINIYSYGILGTKVCNMSPIAWHILLILLYTFFFSKVLFIDPSKACLGDFVAKARSPRMGSKHTESQMEKNSMWSLLRYCSFLGNELTSHLYSLSPILIVFPFHFLSPSSPPFFILFALSVLEVKIRTLFVLGKLFYH